MEGFLRYQFGGLIFGGAYTWRGLFSEFYGIRSLDEFPIITDFCHKYCRINQIFLKFTYF